jgi:putative flavoprotein involved in K+ transport
VGEDVAVIGAGPAGLAAAAVARQHGLRALVVDKAASVGASWRAHYDRLRLHTERALSGLPGLAIPRAHGKWVPRAAVVEYLESYARHHELRLRLETAVESVDRDGTGWTLRTNAGPIAARAVVIATGYNHTARLPDWAGRDSFAGEILHSSQYRNAAPYKGRDVLVAGTGNSGAEIAVDLLEGGASRVRVAVRTPPNIVRREVLGLSSQRLGIVFRNAPPSIIDPVAALLRLLTIGDLTRYGLPAPKKGIYARVREGQIPILDVGFVEALKAGRLTIVPSIRGFDGRDVLLEGGEKIQPDVVLAATGFSRGLEALVGHLGVLDPRGVPLVHGTDDSPAAKGLYFIGYTNPISGNFREIAIVARKLGRALSGRLAPEASRQTR